MSREDAQMKIRLPAELKEQLEKAAHENKRSMNAEVLHRLKESFKTVLHINFEDSGISDSNIWKRFLETSDQCDENTKVFVKLFEEKYKLDKENERLYYLLINHLSHKKNEGN
ncbi:Arc family DNA-binding protein [Salmonella enterica]|uniref:Arc family DNA-binding protein n=1 Tax=Salmonella enterica TaxID=28901 RepID=UPI0009ADE0C2|nr:Arc family DNA-binding protein [Salmonella enterica]EEG5546389.1 Arc family DNA-binding protein [Salmonella enterica subsp. enterica]EEG5547251.1 Arc family DNA-binding protein [Salmonella enterica subsp. enterica]